MVLFKEPAPIFLTHEGMNGGEGGGGQSDQPPRLFLALKFCSLTAYQKL